MPTSRTERKAAGFTLVELLVVLAIMAVAFAIVAPSVTRAIGANGPAAVADDLAVALREARATSIVSATPIRFTIEDTARAWRAAGRRGTWPVGVAVQLETAPQGNGAIVFYPDGSASGGRVVVGTGPSRHILSIDWLTGRVQTPAS